MEQTAERNWQEDWDMCDTASKGPWKWNDGNKEHRDLGSVIDGEGMDVCWFGNETTYYPIAGTEPCEEDIKFMINARTALPHWLQEVKRLREQVASLTCDWQREKSMRHSLAVEANREKKRADEAEALLEAALMLNEGIDIENEVMSMVRAQQG